VINENGYTGKKCDECNTIFISPRPDADEILKLYKEDNAHISAESHISRGFVSRLNARHNLSLIKCYINEGSMLEIGAGGGYFLDEARKAGFRVFGIEPNSRQAKFINNELKISCETAFLNDASFDKKRFDLIYHCDVISHFYDPIAVFNMTNFKLNDMGFVVFETGNFGDVDYDYYKYVSTFQYPDHLFYFSENGLMKLLEQTGFNLVKIYNYSILPQLIVQKYLKSIISMAESFQIKNTQGDNISSDVNNKDIQGHNSKSELKQLARNAYWYLSYLLRYKVGSICSKEGRPQTIIVIAQKRGV
jgi:2-polyprenyl-3-methyl-5-hydroxy-6-metoxy-1,4-benzoquinol methylase